MTTVEAVLSHTLKKYCSDLKENRIVKAKSRSFDLQFFPRSFLELVILFSSVLEWKFRNNKLIDSKI